ncbi:hypothetical protein [Amycolatopsis jejuensis]|uniref:hypothetical protein n=1 Tax=Amycolatopsis jejuensis TaxID=330084 RepID=UPI000527A22C|nr:hypothetical protein [Amycolatopsis jejuensis]
MRWLAAALVLAAGTVLAVVLGTPFIGSWSDRTRDTVEAFSWVSAIGTPAIAVTAWALKGRATSKAPSTVKSR